MGRKEKRDSIRNCETAYYAAGNARQRSAHLLHDRAREIVRERVAQCGHVTLFADRVCTTSGTNPSARLPSRL
jgi:hypothetical protein